MSFLELSGLSKRFGPLTVVDDVSLSVERGHVVCLLGPSGCGKTTTLRLIAGFTTPDAGDIRIDGKVISSKRASVPPELRQMSMIFQSYALWPHMTVRENVAYGLQLRKLPKEKVVSLVNNILNTTQLSVLAERYPGELSGGQQQRVSLARALVVEPQTLLLDEPLSNLDSNLREEMRFEIRRLHDAYRYTTIYVTHDQSEAMTTADVIVIMNKGRIEQIGSPEDIYERPASEFVARFMGGANILTGHALDGHTVDCGGLKLRCANTSSAAGSAIAVSIRQHTIAVTTQRPVDEMNWAAGTVVRSVYLGAHRDYLIELASGERIRAVTSTSNPVENGQAVWAHLPPEFCRVLTR
ncbi:MAG: transporter [Hyphomicrobiales bacterium]|nr:transporter [Hyphomicrobiales bacterium]